MLWTLNFFPVLADIKPKENINFDTVHVVKSKYYNNSSVNCVILVVGASITWTLHEPPLGPNVISEEGETVRRENC